MKRGYGNRPLWFCTCLPFAYVLYLSIVLLLPLLAANSYSFVTTPAWVEDMYIKIVYLSVSGVVALPVANFLRCALLQTAALSDLGKQAHRKVYIFGITFYVVALASTFVWVMLTAPPMD